MCEEFGGESRVAVELIASSEAGVGSDVWNGVQSSESSGSIFEWILCVADAGDYDS